MDQGWLVLGMVAACLVVGFGAREVYLTHLHNTELKDTNRKLNYELMQVSIRWQVDHDKLLDQMGRQHARHKARLTDAAAEIAELKKGVEDALELLAGYRALGIDAENTPLPGLRDQLSQFGRLMESTTTPMDLAERSEWGGFK